MSSKTDPRSEAFRLLPSVEEAAHDPRLAQAQGRVGRELSVELVRDVLEAWRGQIKAGKLAAPELAERSAGGGLVRAVAGRVEREERAGLVAAINATGVVLHTGL